MAVVIKIELWPHGDQAQARPLGGLIIDNDGTGDAVFSNYNVTAMHAGMYFGKRKEPFKTGKVLNFRRSLSPYRLLCRALHAIHET